MKLQVNSQIEIEIEIRGQIFRLKFFPNQIWKETSKLSKQFNKFNDINFQVISQVMCF